MEVFYAPSSGSFFATEINGIAMPVDSVAISEDEWVALLAEMASGRMVVVVDGQVVAIDRPPPPPIPRAVLVKQAVDQIRQERQPILGVLDGLQASYITKGDMPTATVIETAKQALRDITKVDLSACETLAEMKAVVLARYAQIASASPALKSAFAQAVQ